MSTLPPPRRSLLRSARYVLAALTLLLAGACGGGGGGTTGNFVVKTTDHSVDATSAIVVGGTTLVYFADEGTTGAAGTDLNVDGDTIDDVAVAVRMNGNKATVLRAALAAIVVDKEVYILVDEAADGGMDWSGDDGAGLGDDFVLLHWSQAAGVITFIDTIDATAAAGVAMVEAEDKRLFYVSATAPVGAEDTTLRRIEEKDPLTPVIVANVLGSGQQLAPQLLGVEEELVFLYLDENTGPSPSFLGGPTPDYNSDGDNTDGFVLALLDGTDTAATVQNVGLALASDTAPFDARATSNTDWLVGFLVNETAQGGTNLNDQALFANPLLPNHCAGTPDLDTNDDVLHYVAFEDFVLGAATPENTGLAGADRVVVVEDFVSTISPEADSNCNLNNDSDGGTGADDVARWVEAVTPIAPPRDESQLHALFDVPGGSHGLTSLGKRLVIVVDEAADEDDIDGKAGDHTLVAWLDPSNGFLTTWDFTHNGNPASSVGTGLPGEPYAGASWMAEDEADGRLGIGFQEEVPALDLNIERFCDFKPVFDGDMVDTLPVWADFASGPTLDFDGQGYALVNGNAGIVQAKNFAFYRVSEAEDGVDYNNDGDMNDPILFRNPQNQCNTKAMATSSTVNGPVIVTDERERGAAFFASEFSAGVDFNDDGDFNDLVVRFFTY